MTSWETRQLFGHDAAIATLKQALNDGRLHHAWLLTGPAGIGKTTLAFHFANAILSNGAQPIGALRDDEKSFQLVKNLSHPDLRLVGKPVDESTGEEKAEIPVDSIRAINQFFRLTSANLGWRIAIVTDAEAMNRNAQNALLKILEEPPPHCLIILAATSTGELLPTINSRCRTLVLKPLEDRTIRMALQRLDKEVPPAAVEQAVALADGSLGKAMELIENEGLDLHAALMDLLGKGQQAGVMDLQNFADQMARKADAQRFRLFAEFLDAWLQKLIGTMAGRVDKNGGPLVQRYAAARPLAQWIEVWDKVRVTVSACENLHLDRKLAAVQCLSAVMHKG